jgi:hypothetical protein
MFLSNPLFHVLSISHAIVLLDMHNEEMGSVSLCTFDELKLEVGGYKQSMNQIFFLFIFILFFFHGILFCQSDWGEMSCNFDVQFF